MPPNDDRLSELHDELNAAVREVDSLIKERMEQPGVKPDPDQFWKAIDEVRAAKRALSRHATD
jgi:hypothetical protein